MDVSSHDHATPPAGPDRQGHDRNSSFELLRILAMLAIVAGHFISQSAIGPASTSGAARIVTALLGSAPRLAVDVFLLIGCWFLVDAKFRPERLIKLYLELALYTIPVTAILFLCGEGGGFRPVAQGLLPFFGRSHWFISAYLALIALAPFLNRAFELPRRSLDTLVGLLFVFYVLVSTMPSYSGLDHVADTSWFFVVYLFVGWAKRRFPTVPGNRWSWLSLGIATYLALVGLTYTPFRGMAVYWRDNIRCLPTFLCALGIFVFFTKTNLGTVRAVNLAARSTLAVYILTGIPSFIHLEWNVLFRAPALATSSPAILALGIVGVALAAFILASLVDALRLRFLEPRYMSSRPVRWLTTRLATLYA